ncbi:MAG: DUF6110 family protein [Eubacteriales bacterium]|jgi:hypothetical protein|nr:DUF6110 family protein [Lachnospiraceae bacterium]MDD5859579.1 DUF6110 family protein [Eubacteriales bacterium]MCH4064213.1 DUF6110 family protein [Lachnospiraceae bacterium]MCH4103062.1 DUF6110 family protein [Lachnospiraceae bacterium]MCI1308793.1 DUF6110 family protein [Lachnospiraceae bacterium]
MSWNWGKFGLLAGGFLLGTYGVKILGSRDMKNTYTHTTAAVLRMKDEVVKDFTTIGENCSDIAAAAKDINEKREEAYEAEMIENAKAVLAEAEAKKADKTDKE